MAIEIRAITPEEFLAFQRTSLAAFSEGISAELSEISLPVFEFDRSLAAIDAADSQRIVATAGAYSLDLTLPGLTTTPVAGVTWVSVLPTHRRQGLLTAIMRRQLDDVVARGESVAILTASESLIYGRFGYGIASSHVSLEIDRRHTAFARQNMSADDGRVALVAQEEALDIFPALYDEARRQQPGAVSRSQARWAATLHPASASQGDISPRFFVKYTTAQHALTGAAYYQVKPEWAQGVSSATVQIGDLVATTPAAYAALWHYLLSLDLVQTIQAQRRSVDEPLSWLLADPRRLRTTRLSDDLWLRLLDIPAALSARSYSATDQLVFEVVDHFRPDTAGRYLLDTGTDGARCVRTQEKADLTLRVADLGATYLGGVRFSTLARAGRIAEQTPGALQRADLLFAAERLPWCGTPF